MTVIEVCPFHADEAIKGTFVSDEVGHRFECRRKGHPTGGPYEWARPPAMPDDAGLSGLADELGLAIELPAALGQFPGQWVEYGLIERAYARAKPEDWAMLVQRYGHTAIAAKRYTVSAFLGGTLGRLHRGGYVAYHHGPATGRWSYNGETSWYALHPEPDWRERLSWADSGATVDYVPGQTEL
jgi:hypothetical protein